MNLASRISLILGFTALLLLVFWQGVGEILALLANAGLKLLWLPPVWLPSLLVGATGWACLFPPGRRPLLRHACTAYWLGRSINNLLPVASIGGEVARARLLYLWGRDGAEAGASVVVDKTTQAVSVMIWGLIGVSLLLYLADDKRLAAVAFAGYLLLGAGILGFILVQHAGLLGGLARLGGKLIPHDAWNALTAGADGVDSAVRRQYRNPRGVVASVALHTSALILQSAELWLACHILGHPISVLEALMLKSLTSTLSDIAFIIPSGYGIQEGAYIMVGALLGISPETALALSFAMRVRDLAIDLPGLMTWHYLEGRVLLKRSRAKRETLPA